MSVSFEDWVKAVFDHSPQPPDWYADGEFYSFWESLGLSDALTVDYLTRLFLSTPRLKPYSLEQVAQGIWFLIGEASPAQPSYALLRPEVRLGERIACVHSMSDFFRDFVAPAAPGQVDIETDPFHIACYMWWDIFPSYGGAQAGEPELHKACLDVMDGVLALPSQLCRLSALHGLNHWHLHYAPETEQIIDEFLASTDNITSNIREYASNARNGCCQ